MAAVFPAHQMVVYRGPWLGYLFARRFDGRVVWRRRVLVGVHGPSQLFAAGHYLLATGRGLFERHPGVHRFFQRRSDNQQLWIKLFNATRGNLLWEATVLDLGEPVFLDERTLVCVRKDLSVPSIKRAIRLGRNDVDCFIERRDIRTRRVLFRHRFPAALYHGDFRVTSQRDGVRVAVSPSTPEVSNKPEEPPAFSLLIPGVYPVNAAVYPEDFSTKERVIVI